MAEKLKRELEVTRSIRIDECAGGIYAIEASTGSAVDFAASKITLAAKLGELFGLAGELAAVTAPKAKRGRRRAAQPVLAAVPEAEAKPRRGVTVVKPNGEVAE